MAHHLVLWLRSSLQPRNFDHGKRTKGEEGREAGALCGIGRLSLKSNTIKALKTNTTSYHQEGSINILFECPTCSNFNAG